MVIEFTFLNAGKLLSFRGEKSFMQYLVLLCTFLYAVVTLIIKAIETSKKNQRIKKFEMGNKKIKKKYIYI